MITAHSISRNIRRLFNKKPKKRYVNLYHHISRALWYDLDDKVLISGDNAVKLGERIRSDGKKVGWLTQEENVFALVWGGRELGRIYGHIFEL